MKRVGRKKAGNEKFVLTSRFPQLIKSEIEKRKVKGEKATYSLIFEELSNYVGCSINMLVSMKDGKSNPSLITALKVAEYFDTKIEEVWSTEYNKDYVDDRERCTEIKCRKIVFASGLCHQHYVSNQNEKRRKKLSGHG